VFEDAGLMAGLRFCERRIDYLPDYDLARVFDIQMPVTEA